MLKPNVIKGILNEIDDVSKAGVIKIDRKRYTVSIKDYNVLREYFRETASILKDYIAQDQLVRYHEICDDIEDKLLSLSTDTCNIDTWLEFLKMCLYSIQGIFISEDINDIINDSIFALQLSQKYYPVLGYSVI